MKPPLFVRELSGAERRALHAGLRSREAFTLRRAQILLASAEGQRPSAIAPRVGCSVGTVHNAIRAFAGEGISCLTEKRHGPKDARPILDEAKADPLKGILHQSPRRFGKFRSTWTLDLLADVAFEQQLTPRRLSHEAGQAVDHRPRPRGRAKNPSGTLPPESPVPDEDARLRRWQTATVATLFVGYAGYYVCRSVLAVASTGLMNDPESGVDEVGYGRLVGVGIYLYALGKLVNGVSAEYLGGRAVFLLGMLLSAGLVLAFGFAS